MLDVTTKTTSPVGHDQTDVDHLELCLMCRIRVQRITGTAPFDNVGVRDLVVAEFGPLQFDPPAGNAPDGSKVACGELWVTIAGDLVVICNVLAWAAVVVAPVVFDVSVADSASLVVAAAVSPIGVDIVILSSTINSVTTKALAARVIAVRACNLLELVDGDRGVTTGAPIVSVTDRRLDARQFASDAIVRLDDPYDD